jgi:hypothetical protein
LFTLCFKLVCYFSADCHLFVFHLLSFYSFGLILLLICSMRQYCTLFSRCSLSVIVLLVYQRCVVSPGCNAAVSGRVFVILTLSQLMLHICSVSEMFGKWYQKTNKTEDTNKLTLLGFKIIAILHNTRLATFIKLLETASKGLFSNRSQNSCQTLLVCRRTAAILWHSCV